MQITYRKPITTKHKKQTSENITNKNTNITHSIPLKRHPTMQASQTKLKAKLQGNSLTKIMKKQNNESITNKNTKRLQQLNNKQYIPQCKHQHQN